MSSARSLPSVETFVDVLRHRAAGQPDRRAYTFLVDGEGPEISLTYGQLDAAARAIAVALRKQLVVGDRALLLFPSGLDYIQAFFGCLYAGVIAVPVYPPRLHAAVLFRDLHRIRAVTRDCAPSLVLTTAEIAAAAESFLEHVPELARVDWLPTDAIVSAGSSEAWSPPPIDSAGLAFLQYTSGSTSEPRGVMVSHANLLVNQVMIQSGTGYHEGSCMVSWLPLFHDLGLIGAILQPCYVGFPCVFMSPEAFLKRPLRWLAAMSQHGGTSGGGPNFAYELCVRKARPDDLKALDLSRWQVAYNGGEPIRPDTLERFAQCFGPCGFRREAFFSVYGLAEATVYVAGGPRHGGPAVRAVDAAALARDRVVAVDPERPEARRLVGCTAAQVHQRVAIVHPERRQRLDGDCVGEIWLAGPHVAGGYWNRAAESRETFAARLADDDQGPFLRTGDLGFLSGSEIFVTGRLKDLIIVDGSNHYPHDLELSAEASHPAIRPGCSAAFSIERGGERVVLVLEVRPGVPPQRYSEVAQAAWRAVAEAHELRPAAIMLIEAGTIPKTSSGKIQRRACRRLFEEGKLAALASFEGPVG